MAEELTPDQKSMIRMIEKEAIKQGIDPDFALAVAQAESGYRHIPANDPKSTAFGAFQVNKPTSGTLGYDYADLVKHPELAVEAGIKNLVRHANDPRLEGDPARVIAAHHYGADSPYALTGDKKFLDKEKSTYIANIGESLPNGDFPESILQQSNANNENTTNNQNTNNSGSIYGGTPVDQFGNPEMDTTVPATSALGAATGAGLGAIYATKKPLASVARHFGVLPQNSDSLNPFSQKLDSGSMQRYLNSQVRDANSPYSKVLITRLENATGMKIQSNSDIQKAIASLSATETIPAERTAKTRLVNGREVKIPIRTQTSQILGKPQTMLSDLYEPLTLAEKSATAVSKVPMLGPTVNAFGRVLGSAPVRLGATMGNMAGNAQDLSESIDQGNKTNAVLAGAGLASDVGSMIPKVGPVASSFAAILDAYKRARDKDYIGSFTSGLGAVAPYALPFAFGPEVGIPAGIATALGSPLANIAKDYLQNKSKD
jgi:hypothetical protein